MTYTDEQLRRIDSLIAVKIMGWRYSDTWRQIVPPQQVGGPETIIDAEGYFIGVPGVVYRGTSGIEIPHFTTDHNAVAEMRKRLHELTMMGLFIAELNRSLGIFEGITPAFGAAWAVMGTTPLQQCLAALAAVGVDVEKELKEIEK